MDLAEPLGFLTTLLHERQEMMTTRSTGRGFTAENLVDASTGPGVYVLLRREHVVMIGGSPNLRDELAAHQRGERGAWTGCSTHYRMEETSLSGVTIRHDELMDEYRRSHNSNVPAGNRRARTSARGLEAAREYQEL